jgi:hypothetical protein
VLQFMRAAPWWDPRVLVDFMVAPRGVLSISVRQLTAHLRCNVVYTFAVVFLRAFPAQAYRSTYVTLLCRIITRYSCHRVHACPLNRRA